MPRKYLVSITTILSILVCSYAVTTSSDAGTQTARRTETECKVVKGQENCETRTITHILKEASSPDKGHQSQNEQAIDVEEELNNYMEERGWANKYTPGNFRIFQVGTWNFGHKNPKRRTTKFLINRGIAASMAQLMAKVEIIKGIRSEMSASDKLTMPGTDVFEKLNAELMEIEDEAAAHVEEASELLEKLDAAELEALQGTSLADRAGAFFDAVIKKIDETYDPTKFSKENDENLKKLKQALAETQRKEKALKAKAAKLKGAVTAETESSVEIIAKMPLYGVMVLATEESWDPESKRYEVGVLSVWSQKHEARTRDLLSGASGEVYQGDDSELREWLRTQNLVNMVGTTNFTDSNGVKWIVGTGAREIRGGNKKTAKGMAKAMSTKEVAIGIFSNLESHEQAKIASKEITTDAVTQESDTKVAESYAANMKQGFENRNVQGLFFIKGKTIRKHPFTGKKVYVAVSAASTLSNAASAEIERINYQTNLADIAAQKRQKGVKAGLEQKQKEAQQDDSAYREGVKQARRSVEAKSAKKTKRRTKRSTNESDGGTSGSYRAKTRAKTREKTF